MAVNSKQLKHLVALSETLNFHKAADQVFLTQSALSRSIAKFEREFGLQVFDRNGGQVSVTNVGRLVITKARRLLHDAQHFEDDLHHIKSGESGLVSFGIGPFLAATAMPALLRRYHLEYPRIKLNMSINRWDYLVKLLQEDDIEFFVVDVREMADDNALSIQILGSPSIAFYCRTGHPLHKESSNGVPLDGQSLLRFPIASVAIPPAVKHELKLVLGLTEEFKLDIQCDDLLLLSNLLPETDIILLSTKSMMAVSAFMPEIQRLTIKMDSDRFGTWGIVRKANRELSPAADILAQLLCEYVMATVD